MPTKVAMAYKNTVASPPRWLFYLLIIIFLPTSYMFFKSESFEQIFSRSSVSTASNTFQLTTWNMAAINNNPFEYWISTDIDSYNNMMRAVSKVIQDPGESDIQINQIFTDTMFEEFIVEMKSFPSFSMHEESLRKYWTEEYRDRASISRFLKDSIIGKKRLISMPDRITNTFSAYQDDNVITLTRPTVVNCYNQDIASLNAWWTQWKDFIFHTTITVEKKGIKQSKHVIEMLVPIKRSKYPTITEHEESISLPLQLLSLAIFDAILVRGLIHIAPQTWQETRSLLCHKLNTHKASRTKEILETQYGHSHVIFLQEVGHSFLHQLAASASSSSSAAASTTKGNSAAAAAAAAMMMSSVNKGLGRLYHAILPQTRDEDRDQTSVILLHKEVFSFEKEVTSDILALLQSDTHDVPVSPGDLLAITAIHKPSKQAYLLCSFHGDTNGLATIPILAAVHHYATTTLSTHILLFGMDANSYATPEKDQLDVRALAKYYTSHGMNSCYGLTPDPVHNVTTCHARTYLQPQLNKAVSLEEKEIKGDRNPKDFIVFFASDFTVQSTHKDNTGYYGVYKDNTVFPTLSFPSDHAITTTTLIRNHIHAAASDSSNSAGNIRKNP